MKTFKRHKSYDEIKAQCKALGLTLNDRNFKRGWDNIVVTGEGAAVLYNTFNGRFSGSTNHQEVFNSNQDRKEPWFLTLLDFFYTNKA